jgi:hypothetical protein
LGLVTFFKKTLFGLAMFLPLLMYSQETTPADTSLEYDNQAFIEYYFNERALQIEQQLLIEYANSLLDDSLVIKDTLFYHSFIGFDKSTYLNSKRNIRKSLLASQNPPIRKNLNNYVVFTWLIMILFLMIHFKRIFPNQYYLITKSTFNQINFDDFIESQNNNFTLSKYLTWLIISQIISIGLFAHFNQQALFSHIKPWLLILYINGLILAIFILNQLFKMLFSYAFNQLSLQEHYAIIYRIHSYVFAILFLPILLVVYYQFPQLLKNGMIYLLSIYLLLVYVFSIIKFVTSSQFLKSGSILILILYICSFEILPLVVLIASITKFMNL